MEISDILKNYMKELKCTSKELSKASNISETIISRYRTGNRIPSQNNLDKIIEGLTKLSNEKYTKEEITNTFKAAETPITIDFDKVIPNLNKLIDYLKINVNELSKNLNFDASYLSKIRKGTRVPHNKESFLNSLSNYIYKKYNNENLSLLMNIENDKIKPENIKSYLINNIENINNEINNFLKKVDDFNLNDYIKAIKFDKLKVPVIPFYQIKNKNYYGIEEMKKGELAFFKGTVFSSSKEPIFMCSDMPMEDMAKDLNFGKKWMFGIAMCLKKNLHLNIIHNINRPFNEMMLGLESWIPIYMTGQIRPFYFKDIKTNIYNHLNYVSGSIALTGECINGYHNLGKYYITSNKNEVSYYKEKANKLIEKASPLMEIYTMNNEKDYQIFLENDKKIKINRKRYLSSLPLFTISDELLMSILKKNNLTNNEINNIINYKNSELDKYLSIIKDNTLTDYITTIKKDNFINEKIYLTLENFNIDKKIKYDYQDYEKHLLETKEFAKKHKNYHIVSLDDKTFNNITITILEDNYVIISKNFNPLIHFVIRHPKLRNAIEKFTPLVKE